MIAARTKLAGRGLALVVFFVIAPVAFAFCLLHFGADELGAALVLFALSWLRLGIWFLGRAWRARAARLPSHPGTLRARPRPALIAIEVIIATAIAGTLLISGYGYLLWFVALIQGLIALALALAQPQVDITALKLLGLIYVGPFVPHLLSDTLRVLGVESPAELFFPYKTRAAWFGALRSSMVCWACPTALTALLYAHRSRRAQRAPAPLPSRVSRALLIAGLPVWLLLLVTALGAAATQYSIGALIALPWLLATFAAERLAFRALRRTLTRGELARMAAVSCGVALLTLGFVAWAGLIYVGCGNYDSRCTPSFWSNTDWALFRWQELGDYLTLFASAWLALGVWVARRAREEPA